MPHATGSVIRRAGRALRTSLFTQVLLALVLGVLVGRPWPQAGSSLQPLGDGFVRLIKAMIAPLVFCVVVAGITKAGDLRAFGRIGVKALIWFEAATGVALVVGLLAANVFAPGAGMHVDPASLDKGAVDAKTGGGQLPSAAQFVLESLPNSAVGAFAENSLLQVLVLACLVGAALLHLGQKKVPQLLPLIEQAQDVVFTIVGYVMKLAPLAVFGATAHLVGEYGLGAMATYGRTRPGDGDEGPERRGHRGAGHRGPRHRDIHHRGARPRSGRRRRAAAAGAGHRARPGRRRLTRRRPRKRARRANRPPGPAGRGRGRAAGCRYACAPGSALPTPPSLLRRAYSSGFCESIPGRDFFHSPRVKSGISCGAPCARRDRSLSGTGAVQVAAS